MANVDDANPFADILNAPDQTQTGTTNTGSSDLSPSNPFYDILNTPDEQTSAGGAFVRGAERSAAPAAGGLAAAGAGAELGATIGGAITGPAAPIGATVGGVLGGVAGAFGGSAAISKVQDWALSQLPDSWVDKLGLSTRQEQLDQEYHPTASFLGGLAPYALTMKPGFSMASKALPENATAWQKLLANPVTARVFGGAMMGGMEAGQEVSQGQSPNWTNIAISTGFGMLFNEPTRLGESLTETGAAPVRRALGMEPVAPAAETVAQAADAKVMGPGVTEDVYMGSHEQAPEAAQTAQDHARMEGVVTGRAQPPQPDPVEMARRMEPDTFATYAALIQQRSDLQAHLAAVPDETQAAQIRQHIFDTDTALRDMAPQVSAAYRRAADAVGAETVNPETGQPEQPQNTAVPSAVPGAPLPASVEAQVAAIATNVAQELQAAGRPTEEAQAAGALIAQRYKTRASRMQNAIGGPQALYESEGPVIRRGGRPAPSAASPERPVVDPVAAKAAADTQGVTNLVTKMIGAGASDEEISTLIGRKLSADQVAALRQNVGAEPARELLQKQEYDGNEGLSYLIGPKSSVSLIGKEVGSVKRDGISELSVKNTPEGYEAKRLIYSQDGRIVGAMQITRVPNGKPTVANTYVAQDMRRQGVATALNDYARKLYGEDLERSEGPSEAGQAFRDSISPTNIRTPEFKSWFGDSKVVDANGKPQVVYHGTDKQFEAFDPSKGAQSLIWFTSDKASIERGEVGAAGSGRIIDLFASLKNPAGWKEYDQLTLDELESRGYDGAILPNGDGTFVGFAFEPTQLKAVANRGTFDPNDPRILYQPKRGSITFREGTRPLIKLFANADASTFIHETGHQWLEEMMRDAAHPAASDSVRTDADTVRKWLGMKGDQIATKQHEKFARGFEQYVREGVAPSKGLARVFAQFKTWLTSIYQTIKGLGAPITDDIRGVFDRMIAEEPQRTVLTGERGEQPSLATIHEADAEEVHPAEAEAVGDRIASERDRYVAEQPPEIQNEIATAQAARAESGGEAGTGTGGQPEVGGAGSSTGPVPAGGGSGGERGALKPSGGEGVGEGGGPQAGQVGAGEPGDAGLRGERPGSAGGAGAQPLAPNPATRFGARESPFTDKAGNIRVGNLTSDADIAQAIRDSANENNDFIGDRRGVITDGQVLDLADALGMDAAQLSQRKLGQAFNAEQIVAARKLLIQSASDVSAAMKRAADGSDQDVLAYAQAKARHQMIQAHVSGITAEAGRALRAFRSLAGQEQAADISKLVRDSTAKTLFQLKQEAALGAKLDSPEAVSKFVNDARKRGFWDGVLEYWINGLISGPATHATYSVGNTILALEKAGPETAAAALIGAIRRSRGRPGEVVHLGEVRERLKAMGTSLPMALKAAADAMRTGVTTRLPGETPKSLPFQPGTEFAPSAPLDENFRYSDVAQGMFGAVRGIRDGIISGGKLLSQGGEAGAPLIGARFSPLGVIPDIAVRGVPILPVGSAIRIPSRFIASIHSFFRTVNYSMAKNAMAYRSAMEEGLQGNAFDARVADLRQNPTEQMVDSARGEATTATLMGKGSEFVQALGRLTNKRILGVPLLKFIDPFVHIAGNIIDQSIVQRTPLGLLAPEIRADIMGKNGNIAQDTAMARMLVGTGLAIGFGSLAAEKLLSGSGPSDPNDAAMWRLAGNQAHSIRIGDTWYQVNRLGPMGMLASLSADLFEVAHAAEQGDMQKAASEVMHAITQNILDESFMSGPAEFIQAVEDPGRYGQSYIRNFISSFVPYSVGVAQINRMMDPYSRRARTVVDAIKAKVPGLSESIMPRRDVWGEAMPSLNGVGITSIYMTKVGADPVNKAMLDLGISPAAVLPNIRGVQLNPQQYDDYARLSGRMAKQRLDVIVNSPDWQTWPPQTRHDVIQETIRQSRETARGVVMAKYPDIVRQATANKLAPLNGPVQ